MDLFRRGGLIARSTTFEVSRPYSEKGAKRQFVKQLESRGISVVFDVGANSGQYATDLRMAAYTGRIISFEPLSGPFSLLERNALKDPLWHCRRCALGDVDGTISINVAGNAGASSSILPMLKSHQDAFPPANYVGTEEVPIHRLDSVATELLQPADKVFLKIDVQGFEKQVIAGGKQTVGDRCLGMQLELSFLPLYEGGMLIREALDLVYSFGFTLTGLLPGFTDPRDGRMLQADGIFFREDD
ncbi:FkbM family methyltransferase [Mycobacterium sp. 852014-50255_SCH5639931]|uniref:FkbM family methyltransferase n=1 Tax=Mycobacterium sp. 852014-50255_SCH5639931 TaxID=1834112 RepID=UPI0007FB7E66|nr:FkbM family methyltransferase [Mycobacterium sp. 852014-50255_SCH5639931]OBB63393.1 FkbM family methyltransferase [Mycobacterium sp. 852014-50255_SCH5639931]